MNEIWNLLTHFQEVILSIADAWWVHLVVFAFAAFDGFFPSIPSESTIVSLSTLWSTSGRPSIVLLALASWGGAFVGDAIGYFLGRKLGWERFRFLRDGKGRAMVEAAQRGLRRRGLVFIMTGRYIPFGRTAVNLVAGAVRYPYAMFWPRSLLSTFTWAVYSVAIGAVAGAWFEDNHLLAIGVSLVAAFVMALVVERVVSLLHAALDRRHERIHGPDGERAHDRFPVPAGTAPEHHDTAQTARKATGRETSEMDTAKVPSSTGDTVPVRPTVR